MTAAVRARKIPPIVEGMPMPVGTLCTVVVEVDSRWDALALGGLLAEHRRYFVQVGGDRWHVRVDADPSAVRAAVDRMLEQRETRAEIIAVLAMQN